MEIRQLERGEWIIDLGRKWYRVRSDGTVITKKTARRKGDLYGYVSARPATAAEVRFAKAALAAHHE